MKGLFDPSGVVTHRSRTGDFDYTSREVLASTSRFRAPIPMLLSLGNTKESRMVSDHKQDLTHRFWREVTFEGWGNIQFTT